MTAVEAVKSVFSKWKDFEGRASRSEYWWFIGFIVLASMILSLVDGAIFGFPSQGQQQNGPISAIFSLVIFIPTLAVLVRRFHDTGRSGWFALLPAAISLILVITLLLGIFITGTVERHMGMPGHMGSILGATGLMIYLIVSIVVGILMLYWLTRPSEPGPNSYGPPPV